jgi:outer membrane protein assembly factor BamD (BamD/ComL family)
VHAARSAPRGPARGTLTHELAALDAARARLDAGDARNALALLDIYSESFPNGRLALEAEVLRIDALARSGQGAAARQHASAFLRRHPTSVLASRVRAEAHLGE